MRMAKDIKKSIKQTITALAGTMILGKYTLVNKLELAINELAESLKAEEKNCHGSVAAVTSKILGTPSGMLELNNQPIKAIVKMVSNGRINAQSNPIAVCL